MKKKIATYLVAILACTMLFAQSPNEFGHGKKHHKHEPPKIEEMVSNLSAIQKKRLETITQESKKQVDKMQAELKSINSQIRKLLDAEGDQTNTLFPLFEREAQLKLEINKEMYRTSQQISNVLTKEQLKELRERMKADRKKHEREHKKNPPQK
jgi:Spy/CpxP family protein refolding chaperone